MIFQRTNHLHGMYIYDAMVEVFPGISYPIPYMMDDFGNAFKLVDSATTGIITSMSDEPLIDGYAIS